MKIFNKSILLSFFSIILCLDNTYAGPANVSSPAPGRGVIPLVSDHYKTQPAFYDFDNLPAEKITDGVTRRFIMGTQSSVVRWELKAGTVLPVHFHVNEQITRVEKGSMEVYSQGLKYVMKPGQIMIFPPNVPHEFIALVDTVIYEQHTPARQDFLNPEFVSKMAANVRTVDVTSKN